MVDVSNFVNIDISLQNPSVEVFNFNTACIYSPSLRYSDAGVFSRTFRRPDDLLAGGLQEQSTNADGETVFTDVTSNSSVFGAARRLAADRVDSFVVGARTSDTRAITQQVNISIEGDLQVNSSLEIKFAREDTPFTVTFSFDGDPAEITTDAVYRGLYNAIAADNRFRRALVALIANNTTGVISGILINPFNPADTIEIPDTQPTGFEFLESRMATAGTSIADDLREINRQTPFYGLCGLDQSREEILARAFWVEDNRKIHICTQSNAENLGPAAKTGSDIANLLAQRQFIRTAFLYSASAAEFPDARWFGDRISADPGSETYIYSNLAPIIADPIEDFEFTNLKNKFANAYIPSGSRQFTANGTVAGNEFIDTIIGIDWLRRRIQDQVFSFLLAMRKKVVWNENGVTLIGNQIEIALNDGLRNVLNSYNLTLPSVNDFTADERKNRLLNKITWQGQLQSAIQFVGVQGTVGYDEIASIENAAIAANGG